MTDSVSVGSPAKDLVLNPFAAIDEQGDSEVPTATLAIYSGIAEQLARKESTSIDRASSATMCPRRRWYQGQGTPGTPLTPRKIVNFALGDLSEKVIIHFIKEFLVGPGKLYSEVDFGKEVGEFPMQGTIIKVYEQKTLSWKINDEITVTAHLDGLGKRNLDGQWEVIEAKSAADYGFEEFKESGPGDYLNQAHACMMTEEMQALNVKDIRYFYLKKNMGSLWDRLHHFDQATADKVREGFIAARGTEAPERPQGFEPETFRGKPTGREKLNWKCCYCIYTTICHPNAVKEFKSGKPIFYKQEGDKK